MNEYELTLKKAIQAVMLLTLLPNYSLIPVTLNQLLFFNILKETQGPKTQNSRKKLNNSKKKLKVWASFKEIVL